MITLRDVKPEKEKFSFKVWRGSSIHVSEAILHIENGGYYILCNNANIHGTKPMDMCGYKYSIYIGRGEKIVWDYAEEVKILNRKKMNHE